MKEREEIVISGLVIFLLILWLGFPFHESHRFAGSLWGGVLAITGTLLMLVPLLYYFIKRIKWIKKKVTRKFPMRTLLAWHIYAGVLGPILVILHTGHKFESVIGVSLTAMTLIVVLSGFIGRYLMGHIGTELKDKKAMLTTLNKSYEQTMRELKTCCTDKAEAIRPFTGFFSRLFLNKLFNREEPANTPWPITERAARLVDAIADLEYAIKTHETFKKMFGRWLKLHIVLSFVLYGLLSAHIWSAIHFGIRWFE